MTRKMMEVKHIDGQSYSFKSGPVAAIVNATDDGRAYDVESANDQEGAEVIGIWLANKDSADFAELLADARRYQNMRIDF